MEFSPLILDLILGAIILLTAIVCGKRGFYKILMPLIVFAAAVIAAGFLSNTFKAPVADLVFPKIEDKVIAAVEKADLSTAAPEELLANAVTLLPEGLQPVAQRLEEQLADILSVQFDPEGAVVNLARAVTEAAVRIVLWLVLFLVGLVVFSLLKKLLGAIFKLPVISWIDHLLGFLLGLGACIFTLYAAGWVFTVLGISALHEMGAGTRLFSLFF